MSLLSEIAPSEYAGYFSRYVNLIDDHESMQSALNKSRDLILDYYSALPAAELTKAYAPGKWTPKQILQHLSDTERIMACRALRFSRNDQTPLPGFEQDDYVEHYAANELSLEDLIAEYRIVRQSTERLFLNMGNTASRIGTGSGIQMSARAYAFMIAGHDRHHLKVLQERYWNPGGNFV